MKALIFAVVAVWLLAIAFLCADTFGRALRNTDVVVKSVKADYKEVFEGGWVIVFSDVKGCIPCRTYLPVVNAISKTHRIKKFKPSEHRLLAEYFQVTALPTTIVFVNGSEHSRKTGMQLRPSLVRMKGIDSCKKPSPKRSWIDTLKGFLRLETR